MKLEDHPTVQRIRLKTVASVPSKRESLDAGWLKQLLLDVAADDVGFVEIGRPALDDQRQDIFKAFPYTKTLISFVVRMNRGPFGRRRARSSTPNSTMPVMRSMTLPGAWFRVWKTRGIRAMNPAMGFPMEMDRFPGKAWGTPITGTSNLTFTSRRD